MPVIVADTSPLIVLVKIGHVGILPALFGAVTIPPEVASELLDPNGNQAVRDFMAHKPAWVKVKATTRLEEIPGIDAGEMAAISLAIELEAEALLIDDRDGRKAAVKRRLSIVGSVALLERAAEQGMLDLREAFARVKGTDFRINHAWLDYRLQLHQEKAQQRARRQLPQMPAPERIPADSQPKSEPEQDTGREPAQ